MKKILLLPALAVAVQLSAQSYTSYFTGNATDVVTSPTGGVCLMGGATESDPAMQWFLQRADGGDVLVLRASGSDGYNDYLYSDLGVAVNSVETIVFNDAGAAAEAYIHERIEKAEAIWFAGGDQWNYISYWRNTAIDSLINEALESRNIVIGGTSAGMAILGQVYFSAQNGSVTSTEALSDPYNSYMTVDSTAFLDVDVLGDVITDTHYDNPERKGRHTAFLARMTTDFDLNAKGIACDEYTAVCVGTDGIAHVYGEYPAEDDNAYFLMVNCEVADNIPETCAPGLALTWERGGNAIAVCTVKGTMTGENTFDLNDWQTASGDYEWQRWSVDNGALTTFAGAQPDCGLGFAELSAALSLSPNPATESFEVISEAPVTSVRVRNALAETVLEAETATISVASLPAGVYSVECTTPNGAANIRLIKQ